MGTPAHVQAAQFVSELQAACRSIDEDIALAEQTLTASSVLEAAADLRRRVVALDQRVRDALYLPPYDQRQCAGLIQDLNDRITRSLAAPSRTKFSFKNKKTPAATAAPESKKIADAATMKTAAVAREQSKPFEHLLPSHADQPTQPPEPPSTAIHIANVSCVRITSAADLIAHGFVTEDNKTSGRDLYITGVRDCTIDLSEMMLTAVHVRGMERTVLVCSGGVSGSMLLDGCVDCFIVGACRQFRMHGSRTSRVVLLLPSSPIIEDCTGITFSPLVLERDAKDSGDVATRVGAVGNSNRWRDVEDFNWLKRQASPNWSAEEGTSVWGHEWIKTKTESNND